VARETIELAFIVAVQHLPARQRAVMILRDVLGWPAQQTADTLEVTLASANSALQRARVTMREHLPEGRLDWSARAGQGLNEEERRLVAAYVRANESLDIDGLGALLREDLRFAMPPQPGVQGRSGRNDQGLGGRRLWPGRLRRLEMRNHGGQRPAGSGDVPATSRGFDVRSLPSMDVLRIEDGLIAEIITFDSEVLDWLRLPRQLQAG